jgi:hypothetical protein
MALVTLVMLIISNSMKIFNLDVAINTYLSVIVFNKYYFYFSLTASSTIISLCSPTLCSSIFFSSFALKKFFSTFKCVKNKCIKSSNYKQSIMLFISI